MGGHGAPRARSHTGARGGRRAGTGAVDLIEFRKVVCKNALADFTEQLQKARTEEDVCTTVTEKVRRARGGARVRRRRTA